MLESKQIVIIALGNPFRGDDGVGTVVSNLLKSQLDNCTFIEWQDDSLAIINAWEEANLAIVVDATSPEANPGKITRLEINDQPLSRDIASCSSHGLGLAEAINLGRTLDRLPEQLIIYAIEATSFKHGSTLTPSVMLSAREVANNIKSDISTFTQT